jgi:hypothetical protein
MIWLLSNVWWLVPLAIGALALFAFLSAGPGALALYLKIPRWLRLTLGALVILLTAYSFGYSSGLDGCRTAQATAEARADAKAIKAAGRATAKAQEASAAISKETQDAAAEVRVILRDRVCPAAPPRVHELGREAVERAQQALRPAED